MVNAPRGITDYRSAPCDYWEEYDYTWGSEGSSADGAWDSGDYGDYEDYGDWDYGDDW